MKKKKIFFAAAGAILLLCSTALLLVAAKIWNINRLWAATYPLSGIDVSHYQGQIDWEKAKDQGVDFAFIKATEGSSHVDSQFQTSWQQTQDAEVLAGAYHFFSFDSPGATQAELYMETVGDLSGRLVPVIDAEYYGDKRLHPPDRDRISGELQRLLDILEEYYGKKPLIYTTYPFYRQYLEGEFDAYPLWIRNVYYPPFDIGREWQFWQYSDRGESPGTGGQEKYVDLNVFCGDREALEEFVMP